MIIMLSAWLAGAHPTPERATIPSGIIFNDTDGQPLHAHGAGLIMPHSHPGGSDGKFFLVGASRKLRNGSMWCSRGVNLYSSYDLQHWTFVSQIFHNSQIVVHGNITVAAPFRLERPKVLYNRRTASYVLWFHLDDAAFRLGYVGVATSTDIAGPFTFVSGWRPDGQRSLDMTLYEEPDGSAAFLIRSVDNKFAGISRLSDTYTNTTGDGIVTRTPCAVEGLAVWRESPGALYLLGSHLTGWHANPAMLFRSSTGGFAGARWELLGNPTHKGYSYDSQPTFVAPIPIRMPGSSSSTVARRRLLLYMADRWNEGSESGGGSVGSASYVWLPMVRNASDPTGFSMPLLHGKWNGTGEWKVADYME